MSRLLIPIVAVALALSACTSRGPTTSSSGPAGLASPAAVTIPSGDSGGGVVGVVKQVLPAVVNVTSEVQQQLPFGATQTGKGVGTGFILTTDGYIVTNWHVVEGASRITVTTSGGDPKEYQARVVGGDANADLAVLKVDASGLPTVPLGSSGALQLGQRVVAIGYALALEGGPTVTAGIVSAMNRTISAQDLNCQTCKNRSRTYTGIVQTDAAINPGNSGGPLVNLLGQVVGINTAGAGASQAENVGFAIAIDEAKPIIRQAVAHPEAPVGYLGVVTTPVTPQLALQDNLTVDHGAFVVDVTQGGPADKAGIARGDVIVSLDGKSVADNASLGSMIQSHKPGERVSVTIASGGSQRTVTVTLGTRPLPVQS